jgi:hypothetical protein
MRKIPPPRGPGASSMSPGSWPHPTPPARSAADVGAAGPACAASPTAPLAPCLRVGSSHPYSAASIFALLAVGCYSACKSDPLSGVRPLGWTGST